MNKKRPEWNNYFLELAEMISSRSTCVRRKVGALIVKNKHILATGYNGVPKNIEHCTKETCLRNKYNVPSGQKHELCRGLHAEQNAIIQAAVHGVSIEGADLYCTTQPCIVCTKMIINAGIKKVFFVGSYPDKLSLQMFAESQVKIIQIKI